MHCSDSVVLVYVVNLYYFYTSTKHLDGESDDSGWTTRGVYLSCAVQTAGLYGGPPPNCSLSLPLLGCVVYYNAWLTWTSH